MNQQTNTKLAAMIRPGTIPEMNRSPTLTPLIRAYRIIGMDGGISTSITAEVALFAAHRAGGKPCRFCHGMRTDPSALALATAEPETPPNTTEDMTVVESG